eukprot:6388275-Amphidinium_carterae.1
METWTAVDSGWHVNIVHNFRTTSCLQYFPYAPNDTCFETNTVTRRTNIQQREGWGCITTNFFETMPNDWLLLVAVLLAMLGGWGAF